MVFAIGFSSGGRALLSYWYVAANESFTKVFCINVDKPELACHGSCHMKSVSEGAGDDAESPARLPPGMEREPVQLLLQLPPDIAGISRPFDPERYHIFSPAETPVDSLWQGAVFHPPA